MGSILVNTTKKANNDGGALVAFCVFIILLGLIFGILSAIIAVIVPLWNNCLVPAVPVLEKVGFWQMWGIYLVLDILVKSSSYKSDNE
jgi:hypothetical protein